MRRRAKLGGQVAKRRRSRPQVPAQVETSFFVMKQEFALEKARVRTFRRLENIFSLCALAYVYATQFLRKTKGFKKILKFLADNLGTVSTRTHAFLARLRTGARGGAVAYERR